MSGERVRAFYFIDRFVGPLVGHIAWRRAWAAICLGTALCVSASAAHAAQTHEVQPQAAQSSSDVIARGEYLARAGDCIACHTVPGDKLFGGRRPMVTPFGTLYTPNISSDKEYGIGKWTAEQFYTTMHNGRSRDG